MTIATAPPPIRPLTESRPPGRTWPSAVLVAADRNQPTLDLTADPGGTFAGPGRAAGIDGLARPDPVGVQVTLVRARWCARQSRRLPDARTWSTSLALALVETLHGHRPIAQLNRWVDDDVLAAISLHRRRRRDEQRRPVAQPALRSVRLQHASPEVAEVSAHLSVGRRSMAIAFRLEAAGERWLCTAAEFGPRS
jgi:hypothetical protein